MGGRPSAERFRTVSGGGEAAIEVRGSAFHARVDRVESAASARAFIDDVTAAIPDATHHVPAYRVRTGDGPDGGWLRNWSSDAGEPAGSAGKPVLNVLVQRDLENVVVVVARQFGGTELGVGGLARAYGRAASLAVDDAGVSERVPHRTLHLDVDYDDSGTVRGLLERAEVAFDAEYEETVRFAVSVPESRAEALCDRLKSATSGRVRIEDGR